MHIIEPFDGWLSHYNSFEDENSPFIGKDTNYEIYTDTIYNFYIDPAWDYFGSETLYIKILFADYVQSFIVLELMGEWNDAIGNDIMFLKRDIIDHFSSHGVNNFILIGENVFNFHGSDDSYDEEWLDEIEDGWIAALNFRTHILEEWPKYNIDYCINFGGKLDNLNWRTFSPQQLFKSINDIISHRISLT